MVACIWPRGVSKEEANLDEWLKEIAQANELRKWFDHDSDKFEEFSRKYKVELTDKEEKLQSLLDQTGENLMLLYAVKDENHNHAVVLKKFLENHF